MLKHEYLKDTRVATKYGSIELGHDGEFKGLTKEQELELSKTRDVVLIEDKVAPKVEVKAETSKETSTVKTTRKPRAPRKTTTKKE